MLQWAKCVIAKILLCIWLRNSSWCPVIQDWRISCQPSIILLTKMYKFLTAKGLLNLIYLYQFYAASASYVQLMMSSYSRVTSLMPTVNNIVYQDILVLNSWNFTQSNLSNLFYTRTSSISLTGVITVVGAYLALLRFLVWNWTMSSWVVNNLERVKFTTWKR